MQLDQQYVLKVFRTITNNPTAADLDFLIEAHGKIGYYTALAQGEAEQAEGQRKFEEANVVQRIKNENPKATAAQVEAMAFTETYSFRTEENKRKTEARKLANLHQSIEQAINGVKYIGRETNVRIGP